MSGEQKRRALSTKKKRRCDIRGHDYAPYRFQWGEGYRCKHCGKDKVGLAERHE